MIFIIKKKHITLFLISILIILFSFYPAISSTSENKIPIIMYHNIVKGKNPPKGAYVIHPDEFEKDLIYLKANGYTTILMNDLINYVNSKVPLPEKPIILTFDDGHESFISYAVPLLEKYNMKAIVSIVGTYSDFASEQKEHNPDYSYLTWEEIKELSNKEYIEIQNHTYNMHEANVSRIGCKICKGEDKKEYQEKLKNDLLMLQEKIRFNTGKTPSTFTYPFGQLCKESTDILKELGFTAALTCNEEQINLNNINLYRLGRFNRPSGITSETFFNSIEKK